jgi:DNA-binding transcriptional regulator YhcF (GntR family)
MFDALDPRSPTPLYEQIAGRIRLAVASGELVEGDALPSVRGLATELRVNPATVVKAYGDLEIEGFITVRHGAGTFVSELPGRLKDKEKATHAHRLVRALVSDAARQGISARDLAEAFKHEVGSEIDEQHDRTEQGHVHGGEVVPDQRPEPSRT